MSAKTRLGRPKADPKRDLRADLLRTSRALLDEGGPSALSMRDVARRAGCTHQAPYHYFQDRETILAALVSEGFLDLAKRLRMANELARSKGDRAALVAAGEAYVGFALEQPGVFRIMFRTDVCDPLRFAQVRDASAHARQELDRLNAIVHGNKATATFATILWAHVHGLASLLVDGPLSQQFSTPKQRRAHLRDVAARFADQTLHSS